MDSNKRRYAQALRRHMGQERHIHVPDLEELRRTEWSLSFERALRFRLGPSWTRRRIAKLLDLQRTRLVMGAFRFGLLRGDRSKLSNHVAGARYKLDMYQRAGNLEHLVDVCNYMLLEWVRPSHAMARTPKPGSMGELQRGAGLRAASVWLQAYAQSGVRDYLVEVAAYTTLEFSTPRHAAAHFKAEDDSAWHCPEV